MISAVGAREWMVRGMDELIACRRCDSPYCHGCNIYLLSQMLCAGKLNAIKDENNTIIPTADVAPVRHGRWIKREHDMDYYCALCNADMRYPSRYCPNCGSRMDKDGDA